MSKTDRKNCPQTGKWESKELGASQGRKNRSAVDPRACKMYGKDRLGGTPKLFGRTVGVRTIKAMIGRSAKVAENATLRKQRELDALTARDRELDMLFERLYEDNVSGQIDDAGLPKCPNATNRSRAKMQRKSRLCGWN